MRTFPTGRNGQHNEKHFSRPKFIRKRGSVFIGVLASIAISRQKKPMSDQNYMMTIYKFASIPRRHAQLSGQCT